MNKHQEYRVLSSARYLDEDDAMIDLVLDKNKGELAQSLSGDQRRENLACETDELFYLHALIIRPNNTFEIKVNNEILREGKIEDEFDMLPPNEIKDRK